MRLVGSRLVLALTSSIEFPATEARRAEDKNPAPLLKLGRYEAIDRHALAAPAEAEKSIPALATFLTKPAKTDREKARSIFRWMTDRIAYNAEDFLAGKPVGDCSAEAVLKSRKSVCEGYANLFEALARSAGLKVVKIHGYAKGYSYTPGEKLSSNHAWNAVEIEGKWFPLDSTWGGGFGGREERLHQGVGRTLVPDRA